MSMIEPRIYVACLASYNSGVLHGAWIDLAGKDEEGVSAEINEILRMSKFSNVTRYCAGCVGEEKPSEYCAFCKGKGSYPSAEEFAIHDHEGFCGLDVSEYSSVSEVCEQAELLEEHGMAYVAACRFNGEQYALETLKNSYGGIWDSEAAYAEHFAEENGYLLNVDQTLAYCIDWERFADQLDVRSVRDNNGDLHIFTAG